MRAPFQLAQADAEATPTTEAESPADAEAAPPPAAESPADAEAAPPPAAEASARTEAPLEAEAAPEAEAAAESPEAAATSPEAAAAESVDATAAIESGRQALDPGWRGYPWYDSSNDDLRRVRVPRTSNWSPNWSFAPGSFQGAMWVVWGIIALVIAVLAYLLHQVWQGRWVDMPGKARAQAERPVANDAARVEALPFQIDPQTGSLLETARRAYAAGDFALAIVYLFSHELLELDRRHLIRLTRGKTNRQYLRELGRGPLAGLLAQTMVVFEDVFFGNRALSRERFELCWNRLNEFDSLIGPRR
ncbi:MAG: hypothetical protein AB7U73_00630 [Pirellulales bacterium]